MIRHIVLFTLTSTDDEQRTAHSAEMRARLAALVGVVPGLLAIDLHRDLGAVAGHWDLALVSEHADGDALAGYQTHPAHREAAGWIDSVTSARAVVDHELT